VSDVNKDTEVNFIKCFVSIACRDDWGDLDLLQ
jgi:hypothetical protein